MRALGKHPLEHRVGCGVQGKLERGRAVKESQGREAITEPGESVSNWTGGEYL
jgi:hypothetical protein